jgi:CubicO group peptidase (beta-lactamase class C family)
MKWLLFLLYPLHAMGLEDTKTMIAKALADAKIPAIGAVAFDTQKTITFLASGKTRADQDIEVKKDSVWHIGSDAKAMTATLMAILVEKKLISWETTMADIFPDLADDFHPKARKITITQLLSHTAGLPANPEGIERILSRFEVTKIGLKKEPTKGYLYSNFGYIIAGAVIEKLLNTTWEKAIVEHLFTPLGIKSVGFGPPKGPDAIHGHHNGKPMSHDNPPMYGPAGGLHLTLSDWVLFCQDQIKGHHGNGKLLTQSSYLKLHTPVSGNYALGWGTRSKGGKITTLTHDGSNTMWYARVTLDLEKQTGYLVTLNTATPEAVAWIPKIAKTLHPTPK